jgi:FkbM family methyltransferase
MWQSAKCVAKNAVEAVAGRLGYAVLPKWRLPNLDLAEHLKQVLDRHRIDTVVDVGANTGQYAGFLRQEVGFRGLIVSIEPLPECFEALRREAAKDPDWLVVKAALGSTDGEAMFNVMSYNLFSSFLEPKDELVPGMAALNRVQRRIPVLMRRLDSVLPEIERSREPGRIYLKLDTQGFDLEVIKGAGAAIDRVRALQTELSVVPIYERMTDWQVALAAFRQYGFEPTGFWAVARDPMLRVVELDCVLVRGQTESALMPIGRETRCAVSAS